MRVGLLANTHGRQHFHIYPQRHTRLHSQSRRSVVFFTLISCESFCIDCCIPPNCPYILSLTFSRESLTCTQTACTDTIYSRKTAHHPTEPAWLFAACASTHLSDVPHLILKVTDRPLTGHHLRLSFRADALAGHFGPVVLQRCVWDPIGHVSVLLREARFHRSGFPTQLGRFTSLLYFCIYALLCTHIMDASACMFALSQVFPAPVPLSRGKRRLGTSV